MQGEALKRSSTPVVFAEGKKLGPGRNLPPAGTRISKVLKIFFACILGCAALASPADELKPGDKAPSLNVRKWLGKPVATFQPGTVYVVEFWATWCHPCVAAFPHLNKVVQETKGQKVEFISITDEDEKKVGEFLKEHPLTTNVALDNRSSTFKRYGVQVIPNTVVVGADGKIAAITFPEHITADALKTVLAGGDPKLPVKTNQAADSQWDSKEGMSPDAAIAQVIIQPSTAVSALSVTKENSGRIVADGVGLRVLLMLAYGASPEQIVGEVPGDTQKYRVSVKAKDNSDKAAQAMLQTALTSTFGLTAKWEEAEKEVPVLRRLEGAQFKGATSKAPESRSMARSGQIHAIHADMGWLSRTIGGFVYDADAVDETGISGFFDFDINWTPGNTKAFEKSLNDLGLTVVKERRKVRQLQIVPPK